MKSSLLFLLRGAPLMSLCSFTTSLHCSTTQIVNPNSFSSLRVCVSSRALSASPLTNQRHFFIANRDTSAFSKPAETASPPSSTVAESAAAADNVEKIDDDEDGMKVQIFRPQLSPAEAERKTKTELFICLLLTLSRTQDWKDMLTAAFRAGTWRQHHLDTVLRGVLLNKYNEPQAFLLSCGSAAATVSIGSLREAAVEASQSAPLTSSATKRLHRARDVLMFCADEGVLYSSTQTTSDGDAVGVKDAAASSSKLFAPSPASVHHLLSMLLQAAQRGAEYVSPTDAAAAAASTAAGATATAQASPGHSALPVASYAEVWHFLAWMELHGYHVLSSAVLDALEAAVDEGGSPSPLSGRHKTSELSGESAPATSEQYAMVSQRIHRLDYVRGERALLREAQRSGAGNVDSLGKVQQRRKEDIPRADPHS